MRDLSWWLEWPAGVVRVGVVFLVGVTLIADGYRYPTVLGQAGRDATNNSRLSYADREIAGGNGLVADQLAVYAARGLIPEDARYKVVVNPDFQGGTTETVHFVDSFYRYFLMPRRPAESAPWIICYACDLEEYGSRAKVVWEGELGISIVRIAE
jgi:hypothetical protein